MKTENSCFAAPVKIEQVAAKSCVTIGRSYFSERARAINNQQVGSEPKQFC